MPRLKAGVPAPAIAMRSQPTSTTAYFTSCTLPTHKPRVGKPVRVRSLTSCPTFYALPPGPQPTLPAFAGLIRYDEILTGEIRHALRFTVPQTLNAYIWPARHYASSLTGAQYPPMGARFRLKASFNISGFSATNQIILTALKTYGMMLADNGSSWFISGAP